VILPFVLPHIAGITDMHHHAQPLVEMESQELLAQPDLKTILLISTSRVTGIRLEPPSLD
jgi:hypothetical protein